MARFKVNDKVICIDTNFSKKTKKWVKFYPKLLQTYTIRKIIKEDSGRYGVLLKEIVNPKFNYKNSLREPTFDEKRFVLIEEDNDQNKLENIDYITQCINNAYKLGIFPYN